jgi:glycine cleavage system transcriptional repressor
VIANIVFTLTGADRVGIVDEVTQLLLRLGGNIETSRMARLGGEFAILMLVALPSEQLANLGPGIKRLTDQGYKVTTTQTRQLEAGAHDDWRPYRIEVQGADHEGIIHDIARALARSGINIESMETGTARASTSGTMLFSMTAIVAVPRNPADPNWERTLAETARRMNVDIKVTPSVSV